MMKNNQTTIYRNIIILLTVLVSLSVITVFLIILTKNHIKAIDILNSEKVIIEEDKKIMEASVDLTRQYENEINVISNVFPNDENISEFIQVLESKIKEVSSDYRFQFNSLNPIPEQDKLYLLLTLTMKTDISKLLIFLSDLEAMPYMTHLISLTQNSPQGLISSSEIRMGIKLYVQKPFTDK